MKHINFLALFRIVFRLSKISEKLKAEDVSNRFAGEMIRGLMEFFKNDIKKRMDPTQTERKLLLESRLDNYKLNLRNYTFQSLTEGYINPGALQNTWTSSIIHKIKCRKIGMIFNNNPSIPSYNAGEIQRGKFKSTTCCAEVAAFVDACCYTYEMVDLFTTLLMAFYKFLHCEQANEHMLSHTQIWHAENLMVVAEWCQELTIFLRDPNVLASHLKMLQEIGNTTENQKNIVSADKVTASIKCAGFDHVFTMLLRRMSLAGPFLSSWATYQLLTSIGLYPTFGGFKWTWRNPRRHMEKAPSDKSIVRFFTNQLKEASGKGYQNHPFTNYLLRYVFEPLVVIVSPHWREDDPSGSEHCTFPVSYEEFVACEDLNECLVRMWERYEHDIATHKSLYHFYKKDTEIKRMPMLIECGISDSSDSDEDDIVISSKMKAKSTTKQKVVAKEPTTSENNLTEFYESLGPTSGKKKLQETKLKYPWDVDLSAGELIPIEASMSRRTTRNSTIFCSFHGGSEVGVPATKVFRCKEGGVSSVYFCDSCLGLKENNVTPMGNPSNVKKPSPKKTTSATHKLLDADLAKELQFELLESFNWGN